MDYGHATQSDNSNSGAFFTAGAGTQSVDDNTFENENNLDLANPTWGNTSPQIERNPRNIGANVLASHESNLMPQTPPEASSYQRTSAKPEIGQIVNLEMPPSSSKVAEPHAPDQTSIKGLFSGDKLTEKGLELINEEETKFRQGAEEVADFYDKIAELREASQPLGGDK